LAWSSFGMARLACQGATGKAGPAWLGKDCLVVRVGVGQGPTWRAGEARHGMIRLGLAFCGKQRKGSQDGCVPAR